MVDQPPYLAFSNPAIWVDEMALLAGKDYRGYQIVSTRDGIVSQENVRDWGKVISFIHETFDDLLRKEADLEEWMLEIPKIMRFFNPLMREDERYYNRLRWGIKTWYEQVIKTMAEVENE